MKMVSQSRKDASHKMQEQRKKILFGQLNCCNLSSTSVNDELDRHMNDCVTYIQEDRQVHIQEDADIKATKTGRSTMFTASATSNRQGAAIGVVRVVLTSPLIQNLVSITKTTYRTVHALLKGNLKKHVISCHSMLFRDKYQSLR